MLEVAGRMHLRMQGGWNRRRGYRPLAVRAGRTDLVGSLVVGRRGWRVG